MTLPLRRAGRSGLDLPAISLGLWQNFGETTARADRRRVLLHAVERGVVHLDLANNYGPPPFAAEEFVGDVLRSELRGRRDEIVLTTKAGYHAWPGRYGNGGSRKYLLASLDRSLRALGTDSVDVFYSHRFDPSTPLTETIGALAHAVRTGRARYAGISSYSARRTREALAVADDLGLPLTLHQSSYSVLNRWIEEPDDEGDSVLDVAERRGMGLVAFSPSRRGCSRPSIWTAYRRTLVQRPASRCGPSTSRRRTSPGSGRCTPLRGRAARACPGSPCGGCSATRG